MGQALQGAAPVVRAVARLQHHGHARVLAQLRQQLPARAPTVEYHTPGLVHAAELKDVLCQVNADEFNFHGGCLLFRVTRLNTASLAHRDAVSGGEASISSPNYTHLWR